MSLVETRQEVRPAFSGYGVVSWKSRYDQVCQELKDAKQQIELIKTERDQFRAAAQKFHATAEKLQASNLELRAKIAETGGDVLVSEDPIPEPDLSKPTIFTIDKIQRAVCDHYEVTRSELVSIRRTKGIVWPRHVAMYLCQKHTHNSMPGIARMFGNRDHTTVLHAVRKVSGLLGSDAQLQADIVKIVGVLQNNEIKSRHEAEIAPDHKPVPAGLV